MYSNYRHINMGNFEEMIITQMTSDKILIDYLNEHNIRFEMSEEKFKANIGKILHVFNIIEGLVMILNYIDKKTRNTIKISVLSKFEKVKTFQTFVEAEDYVISLNPSIPNDTIGGGISFKYV